MTAFPNNPFKNGLGLTTIGAPDDMMNIFDFKFLIRYESGSRTSTAIIRVKFNLL